MQLLEVATHCMCCCFCSSRYTKPELCLEKRCWHVNFHGSASLLSAHSEAPEKTGWMASGTQPDKHKLTNSVIWDSSLTTASPVIPLIMCFRCWGHNPSTPSADPGQNNLITCCMLWQLSVRHMATDVGDGGIETAVRAGCLLRRTSAMDSSSGA